LSGRREQRFVKPSLFTFPVAEREWAFSLPYVTDSKSYCALMVENMFVPPLAVSPRVPPQQVFSPNFFFF